MVHANSIVPGQLLEGWLKDPSAMLDSAELWISAGTREHWEWSLNYSRRFEEGYTYWGSRLQAQELRGIFGVTRGGVAQSSAKLFEEVCGGREQNEGKQKPNVVIFYVNEVGVIGAGLVTQCEFDFLSLFWPSERKSKEKEFPFRFKMRIIWLEQSVFSNNWQGDPELTNLLRNHVRSGLQRIANLDVASKTREILKDRVKKFTELKTYLLIPKLGDWLQRLDVKTLQEYSRKEGLFFTESVLEQVVAALKGGKHLLLIGPPGTGKTTLARIIASTYGLKLIEKTATSEWSRVDIVGGPVFVGGEVYWRSGALLEAIAEYYRSPGNEALLLIDEINRANMDRAFGEFFTIFSSSESGKWSIPESLLCEMETFGERGKIDEPSKILLNSWSRAGKIGALKVPESFRIIATMNIYDRRYLFTLGYALLRRFAVVEVENPDEEDLRTILRGYCDNENTIGEVLDLYKSLKKDRKLELGVAFLIDLVKLACSLMQRTGSEKKAVDKAVKMIVVPQLEGLMPAQLRAVKETLKEKEYEESLSSFEQLYPEVEGSE